MLKGQKRYFLARLEEIARTLGHDPEKAHCEADEILCRALATEGHSDLVKAWEKIPKWHA